MTTYRLPNSMEYSQKNGVSDPLGQNSETSLLDMLLFVKSAWKMIGIMGVVGLIASCVYLLVTPFQYQAIATITMARASAPNNALGANIEEPSALINRMTLPNAFSREVMNACGFEDTPKSFVLAANSIKFSIPKGLTSAVELKVMRPTLELTKICTQKVVESIIQSQMQMLESSVAFSQAANKSRLAIIAERMNQDKVLLAKAEQSRGLVTPTYFAILSEIRALEDEENRIRTAINNSQPLTAQLQGSIQASDYPVYPKRALSLVAGVLGGLFFGILIALARR